MQKHTPEVNGSGVQPAAIILPTAMSEAGKRSVDFAVSRTNTTSTSLPLGGMTKVRGTERTRFAGAVTFTHSPSFGPEPEVGFGGY